MGVCLGMKSVWSILAFVFDELCVRVMSKKEVNYEVVTKGSTYG